MKVRLSVIKKIILVLKDVPSYLLGTSIVTEGHPIEVRQEL